MTLSPHFYRCTLLTLGLACCPVAAQTDPPSPLTAEQAVTLALQRNPRLSAAAREIGAARAGVRSAGALTNPSIIFAPGITSLSGTGEEFLAQQPLELNGTRSARKGVAQARLRQTQAQAVVELRNLVAETKTAYVELARARDLRATAADVLRTFEEIDRAARRQVEVGTRPGIDQTQTGIEVTRAQQQLTLAEGRAGAAAAALNTLLARPPEEPIGALVPLTPATPAPDSDAARRQAETVRAEIAAAEAVRDALRGEARLARAEGRPDLAPQFRAGSLTRGVHDTGIGLGISLPFVDWGSRRNRIRQAEEAARAQEDRIAAERNRVRQEVEQALTRVRATENVVRSYQNGLLQQARTLLEASQKGFQAGLTTVVSLLEAQRTYRSVLNDYTNALADQALARAELERAVGEVSADLLPAVNPTSSQGKKSK